MAQAPRPPQLDCLALLDYGIHAVPDQRANVDFPVDPVETRFVSTRFRLLQRIGAGATGEVFEARDLQLRRTVALKFISNYGDRVPHDLLVEAQAAAALNHPHIATVYELALEGNAPFIVMELVAGETLRARLDRSRPSLECAVQLAVQIAEALVAAHDAGCLHCDLSPSNVLVAAGDQVKVVDFGLARLRPAQGTAAWRAPGSVLGGTIGYMSPEQLMCRPLDGRTDLFSLGVILYEMVAGVRPFDGDTLAAIARATLTDEPRPLSRHRDDVPLGLEGVVRRALEKDPEGRYSSARDMLLDLQALRANLAPRRTAPDSGETAAAAPRTAPTAPPEAAGSPSRPSYFQRVLRGLRLRRVHPPSSSQPTGLHYIAFRGLVPFQEGDRDRFFGREDDILSLFDRLTHHDFRFGVLFGESGCGKTSLLRAGLVPRLWERGFLPIYCRASNDPERAALEECRRRSRLERAAGQTPVDYLARVARMEGTSPVLIFDQLEEFFVNVRDPAQRRPFLSFVAECATRTGSQVKVLAVIRSEFLYLIGAELEGLVSDPLKSSHLYCLRTFDEGRAAGIIEATADRAALPIDATLVRQVARDLAAGGTVLPSELQIVGERLQARRIFSLAEYSRAGGKEALVSEFLDEVIDGTGQRDDAVVVLHSLVSGEGTRIALRLSEIAERTHRQPAAVARLIRVLVDASIVRALQDEEPWRYELIHDYLVNRVQRLAGRVVDATERANKLFRHYLSSYVLDARTRIPLRKARFIRRHSDLLRGDREQGLLRRSIRAGRVGAWGIALAVLGLSVALAAAFSKRDEWDSVRLSDGHSAAVRRVAFSPGGKLLASCGEDGRVVIWSFPGREQIATLSGHSEAVGAMAFSPNGRWLATGSNDATVIVWDSSSLGKIAVLRGHQAHVTAVAFSPDGRWLVTSGPEARSIVWDTGRWSRVREMPAGTAEQGTVVFLPRRGVVFAGDPRVWDPETGRELRPGLAADWADYAMSLSPDGSLLGWMGGTGTLRVGDVAARRLVWTDRAHRDHARAVQFSPDGRILATAAEDIVLWDVVGRRRLSRLEHTAITWSVAFSPDGRWLVSGHGDGAILVWDVAARERVGNLAEHAGPVRAVAFSSDGGRVASASEDRSVLLWDVGTRRKLAVLMGHQTRVMAAAFLPGTDLASCDQDGTVIVWDVARRAPRWSIAVRGAPCYVVAVSPDGRWVASSLGVHEAATGRAVFDHRTVGASAPRVYGLAFSPDGRRLAVGVAGEKRLIVVTTDDWRLDAVAEANDPLCLSFSPDGRSLASGDDRGAVKLWDVEPLRFRAVIGQHGARVKSVTFSPDGRELASAGDDRALLLWDVAKLRLAARIDSHPAPVLSVAFSPDGRRLVSGEHDRSVRLHTRHRVLLGRRLD